MVNASDSGSRGRGSSPTRVKPCCVLEQATIILQKVLVIPRKRWLRPNMTEKLFTGTLRINQPTIYSGANGRGVNTCLSRVVSLGKDTFTPRKVLVNWKYPGNGGSVPTKLENVDWDV